MSYVCNLYSYAFNGCIYGVLPRMLSNGIGLFQPQVTLPVAIQPGKEADGSIIEHSFIHEFVTRYSERDHISRTGLVSDSDSQTLQPIMST